MVVLCECINLNCLSLVSLVTKLLKLFLHLHAFIFLNRYLNVIIKIKRIKNVDIKVFLVVHEKRTVYKL